MIPDKKELRKEAKQLIDTLGLEDLEYMLKLLQLLGRNGGEKND